MLTISEMFASPSQIASREHPSNQQLINANIANLIPYPVNLNKILPLKQLSVKKYVGLC